MDLLLYFALPISTIILAIVLQRIIRCPILVAATAFAIYLIVTYTAFDSSFLVFTLIYTILAYIAATITKFINENIGRNLFVKNITTDNIDSNNVNTNTLNVADNTNNGCNCPCNRTEETQEKRNYRYR